jgi:putative tricarboxylic transport membrane protein
MKNRDLVSSLFWMTFGILFLIGGLQHGLMRRGVPGPGFLPFFSGILLVLISFFVLIPALARKTCPEKTGEKPGFFPETGSLKRILMAIAALLVYGVAMEIAGYLLTTFIFMYFVAQLMESKKRLQILILALSTSIISYLLFVVLLEVQLPKGLLGI